MKYINIYNKLTSDIWLIKPSVLQTMISLLEKHEMKSKEKADDSTDMITALFPDKVLSEKIGNITKINLVGIIGQHLSNLEMACGGIDTIAIANEIDKAELDETCNGILLYVDSPGGTCTGVIELADKIKNATKPIIAFTDNQICSAAYWIASQTMEILATKSSCIGSIGAYISLLDTSKLYSIAGLKRELIKDGEFKAIGTDGLPLSDTDRKQLQDSVDSISGTFKNTVKSNRDIKDNVMQGQTYFGYEAINVNLIDGLVNNENEAIEYLKGLLNIQA